MKNKTLKKTLLISTGLLAAGGICIGIGIAMGGSPVFYLDNDGIHLFVSLPKTDFVPADRNRRLTLFL